MIGLYPSLSSSEIELFCRFLITLSVKITLGGSAAAWLISGQQLLRPWLLLAVLLPAKCVYECTVVAVCTRTPHLLFVPFQVRARARERCIFCSRCGLDSMAWLSSACQPAACAVARSPSSSPLLTSSLPAHTEKPV